MIAFVVVCFACTGHGRRLQSSSEHNPGISREDQKHFLTVANAMTKHASSSVEVHENCQRLSQLKRSFPNSPLKSFAMYLLEFNPASAWRVAPTYSKSQMPFGIGRMSSFKPRVTSSLCAAAPPSATTLATHTPQARKGRKTLLNKQLVATTAVTLSLLALGVQRASAMGFLDSLSDTMPKSGFLKSFILIFFAEIGDNCFFTAGLLAAKFSRTISFIGSTGALAVMSILSVSVGQIIQSIPKGAVAALPWSEYATILSFTYFGVRTLYDAARLPAGESNEQKEAEEAVEELTSKKTRRSTLAAILQVFGLVFTAEIGDRSCLTTVALAAALDPISVGLGAILAHAGAIGIAVFAGGLLVKYLSEKIIGYIGGSFFLLFALSTGLELMGKVGSR